MNSEIKNNIKRYLLVFDKLVSYKFDRKWVWDLKKILLIEIFEVN